MESAESILITLLNKSELPELEKIGRDTFFETFEPTNTPGNLQHYLDTNFNQQQLQEEFKNPNSEFYLAKDAGKVIGYLKINTGDAQTEDVLKLGLEIERIYIFKSYYGKGVGQGLFNKALDRARRKGIHDIWLGVWEKNYRAIRFYEKNGFEKFDSHIFRLGNSEQTDYLMKRRLYFD